MKALLNIVRIGLAILGPLLVVDMLLVLGIAGFIWFCGPERLAMRVRTLVTPAETNLIMEVIVPQPERVTPADTNVLIINPTFDAYLNGAATNAAVWANGKAFKSGGPAAWEVVKNAWRLWLLGAGATFGGLLLRRRRRPGNLGR